jgi:hypothetical protein
MRCATCCPRSRLCSMAAWAATRSSGCRSCARPASAPGSTMPRPHAAAGLRQLLSGGAGAVRHAGRRVLAAARAGRADRPDVRAAGHRLRRAGAGPDRIGKPPPCAGQRPDATCGAAGVAFAHRRHAASPGRSIVHRQARSGGQSSTRQPSGVRAHLARGHGPRATTESPAAAPGDLLQEHIVSPAPTTERLQSIQRMVADQLGDALPPDFSASVLQSIPVQAGGLYPISDVWYIEPAWTHRIGCASTSRSSRARSRGSRPGRVHRGPRPMASASSAVAHAVGHRRRPGGAGAAGMPERVSPSRSGPGQRATRRSTCRRCCTARVNTTATTRRLSDTALVKLFRLLRLARRLLDLEAGVAAPRT